MLHRESEGALVNAPGGRLAHQEQGEGLGGFRGDGWLLRRVVEGGTKENHPWNFGAACLDLAACVVARYRGIIPRKPRAVAEVVRALQRKRDRVEIPIVIVVEARIDGVGNRSDDEVGPR